MDLKILPGRPRPLGASRLPDGSWNFAVFSQNSTAVDLCLFDAESPEREKARIRLPKRTGSVWHVAVKGIEAGQHYGFRVHGPWEPEKGHRFNPNKLLIDPYARAISGVSSSHVSMCNPRDDQADKRDSAAFIPKAVLIDPHFEWENDQMPRIPAEQTIIYELHVTGFTRLLPKIPKHLRGTYAGLASDEAIGFLKDLGVTSLQLMPVHQHLDDGFLVEKGLSNYWGYQTLGFFAPEARYAATSATRGDHVREFKGMVKRLHAAGLEVILDVVYNHTCEQGPQGPCVSFRGFDNTAYYRNEPRHPGHYRDFTGCGNTLDLNHPYVLQLVLDSLRYWAEEMRVDGFRFDLAATLGRENDAFNREGAFFKAVHQDPILAQRKLIAEPWDLGMGGYQVGGFPEGWAELNGKYRDVMRRFWLGEPGLLPEFASRLTGSEDHYALSRRPPQASVNFITSHDGFTMHDLVSYERKHNEANGEDNRDGDQWNHSCHHGVEGPTDDKLILKRRDQHRRNLMAMLLLSQGTPFILGGDELSRTQQGNNNAYCQDNSISWVDWSMDDRRKSFLKFVTRMIAYRKSNEELRRTWFFHGDTIMTNGIRDVVWLGFDGDEHQAEDWFVRAPGQLMALLHGRLLLMFNANHFPAHTRLPEGSWRHVIDTTLEEGFLPKEKVLKLQYEIPGSSTQVFERG